MDNVNNNSSLGHREYFEQKRKYLNTVQKNLSQQPCSSTTYKDDDALNDEECYNVKNCYLNHKGDCASYVEDSDRRNRPGTYAGCKSQLEMFANDESIEDDLFRETVCKTRKLKLQQQNGSGKLTVPQKQKELLTQISTCEKEIKTCDREIAKLQKKVTGLYTKIDKLQQKLMKL